MLTLKYAGRSSTSILKEDVAKHPGSLLHSMVMDTAPDSDSNVVIDTSSLTGSPLANWPEAVSYIGDIYRQGYIGADTLASHLSGYTPTNLLKRLQQLVDYLALPGRVLDYLPLSPCNTTSDISLMHVGLLPVRYQALAEDAVHTIMQSCTLDRSAGVKAAQAVAFCVAEPASLKTATRLEVYAVSSSWSAFEPWRNVDAITTAHYAKQLVQGGEGGKPSERLVCLNNITSDDIVSRAISASHRFPLKAALAAAVSGIPVCVSADRVCCTCKNVSVESRGYARQMPVWVVYWS